MAVFARMTSTTAAAAATKTIPTPTRKRQLFFLMAVTITSTNIGAAAAAAAAAGSYSSSSQQHEHDQKWRYSSYDEDDPYDYSRQYKNNTTTDSMRWLLQLMEYMTRTHVIITMAVLVLVHVQFQDSIRAWFDYYFPPHVSWSESFTALFWQGADWMRGNGYRFLEFTRTNITPSNTTNTTNTSTKNTKLSSSSLSYQLPPLETCRSTSRHGTNQPNQRQQPRIRIRPRSQQHHQQFTVPPAFQTNEEYPEGWMVYHATLGVISKTDADAYDAAADPRVQLTSQPPQPPESANIIPMEQPPSPQPTNGQPRRPQHVAVVSPQQQTRKQPTTLHSKPNSSDCNGYGSTVKQQDDESQEEEEEQDKQHSPTTTSSLLRPVPPSIAANG